MTFILTAEQETLELSTIQHTPDKKRLLQKMCISPERSTSNPFLSGITSCLSVDN